MDIFVCPQCSAESFVHHDPSKPHPNSAPVETDISTRSLRPVSAYSTPIAPPIEIDPEKLAMFQARFAKELEELEYLEWRSRQPGWKNEEVQQRIRNISTTAAGVAIGTSILRSQINNIQNSLSSNSDGESSSWIEDLFS